MRSVPQVAHLVFRTPAPKGLVVLKTIEGAKPVKNLRTVMPVVALLAVIALVLPAVAKPTTRNITFNSPAKIGSTLLEVGEYKLVVDGEQVTVRKGREVVAEARGRWEERDSKFHRNTLVVDANKQVREIRFAGKSQVLILE
jgi:hypothetical protein